MNDKGTAILNWHLQTLSKNKKIGFATVLRKDNK